MTGTTAGTERGHESARSVAVWDPLVRIVHWTVALAVLLNGFVTDPETDLHQWIGYAAMAAVATRLVWGLVGSGPARFAAFPPSPGRALAHLAALRRGSRDTHLSHNPLGALMVYNLWATLALMGVSGYMMGMLRFFGMDWVKEMHELAFDWLMVSVALHLVGVVFDTRRTGVPLVRAMITGRKRLPPGVRAE